MTGDMSDDAQHVIDQARWLVESHTQRSEALATRAVAVLGFSGVVLALLLQGAGLKGIDPSFWTWSFLGPAVACLLAGGWFALRALKPRDIDLPKIDEFREQYRDYREAPKPGTLGWQIAESLLNSSRLLATSTASSAMSHADGRAKQLGHAVTALFWALFFIALLLINLLLHTWKG